MQNLSARLHLVCRSVASFSALGVFAYLSTLPCFSAEPTVRCTTAWKPIIQESRLHAKVGVVPGYSYGGVAGENYESYQSRMRRTECVKDWTVLVYMAAANDLRPFAYWNLDELEAGFQSPVPRAGSTSRTDVIVQLETQETDKARRFHIFEDRQRPTYEPHKIDYFKSANDNIIKSPVASEVVINPDQEADLRSFLLWGVKNYPAKRYLVIVWGHGQGWRSDGPGGPEVYGGIGFDERTKTNLSIPALERNLRAVKDEIGRPIDVYLSDACLMQMLEVTTELRDDARFIVGSTQVQNYLGLAYRRLMYEINSRRFYYEKKRNPTAGQAYWVAMMIPRLMQASLVTREPGDTRKPGFHSTFDRKAGESLTSGALVTAELENQLLPELRRFSSAMVEYLSKNPLRKPNIRAAAERAIAFENGAQDFGVFVEIVRNTILAEMTSAASPTKKRLDLTAKKLLLSIDEIRAALNRVVISRAYGTEYIADFRTKGVLAPPKLLSIWLPTRSNQLSDRIEDFKKSRLYRETSWGTWIEALHSN